MARQVFINVAVKDLKKTKAFFAAIGFTFDPQFTSDDGACMIIEKDSIYAMLLTEKMFKTFTDKDLSDTKNSIEVINAVQIESKDEVDATIQRVIAAGGKALKTQDHGWMYARDFEDVDGHTWEVFWMDPKGPPKA